MMFSPNNLIEFMEALIKDAGKKVLLILDDLRVHPNKITSLARFVYLSVRVVAGGTAPVHLAAALSEQRRGKRSAW